MFIKALTTAVLVLGLLPTTTMAQGPQTAASCAPWLDQNIDKLHSEEVLDLCSLTAGKPVLLVNTASFCGYTPQFTGLQTLYQDYKDKGLVVIGFPSDDFFQEANDSAATAEVCYINYGVTFPMTTAIKVRGSKAHPIFQHLNAATEAPSWNFNKYLVGKDGVVREHFGSNVTPESATLRTAIEQAL